MSNRASHCGVLSVYASFVGISRALHLSIFYHPAQKQIFGRANGCIGTVEKVPMNNDIGCEITERIYFAFGR
jgi:hypothetical protein